MSLQSRTVHLMETLESENETMKKKIKWVVKNAEKIDVLLIKAELMEMMKELGYEC